MTTYRLQHEGQNIPIPAEIAADENKLRRALSSIVPGIAEAKITSTEEDDVTTFTVTKVAGTKGADDALGLLMACTGGQNAVMVCYAALEQFDFSQASAIAQTQMDQQIETALHEGGQQRAAQVKSFKRLAQAAPQPASWVARGF